MSGGAGDGWTRYADRFESKYFENDEPVRLWLLGGGGVDDELLVPEALWHRLALIGLAYRLHLLPLLDGSTDPVHLSREQSVTLADEVDFVTVASDDGALITVAELVIRLARRAAQGLGVEVP